MGMPVKLSDDLVLIARQEADLADRSITGQIEHWAKLGRAVEVALKYPEITALKKSGGDLKRAFAEQTVQDKVFQTLKTIATSTDRALVQKRIGVNGKSMYGSDPNFPGMVVHIAPDGTRTLGYFKNRRFVPADSTNQPSA